MSVIFGGYLTSEYVIYISNAKQQTEILTNISGKLSQLIPKMDTLADMIRDNSHYNRRAAEDIK